MPETPYQNFNLVDFTGGLQNTKDPDKIPDNAAAAIQNFDFEKNSLFTRHGFSLMGTSATSGSIVTSHTFNLKTGVQSPMRSLSSIMEYWNGQTSAWALLSSGFSYGFTFDYADYPPYTYFCNGIDAMFAWNGQWATVNGAHAASATVVTLSTGGYSLSALGWLSAGEAIIGTQPVYYGSITGSTLSAMTGISAAIASNTEVAQAPTSSRGFTSVSSIPRGNILEINTARLHVAGVSASPTNAFYSQLDDPTDFTYTIAGRTAGQGGVIDFPEGGGPINNLTSKEQFLVVGKRNYLGTYQFVDIATGVTDVPQIQVIKYSENAGIANTLGTAVVENDPFFVSPIGGVRSLTTDIRGNIEMFWQTANLEETVGRLIFTNAASIYFNQKYYLACQTDTGTFNDTVLVYDYRYQAWSIYKGWNVSDWFIYKGALFFSSPLNRASFQALATFEDAGGAINYYWYSKRFDFGNPCEAKRMRYVFIEGYISPNASITFDVLFDDATSPTLTKTISGTGPYVNIAASQTIGMNVIGNQVFGGSPVQGIIAAGNVTLNKFRVKCSLSEQNFFVAQFKFSSFGTGYVYRIQKITPYVEQEDGAIFPIQNII